MTEQTTLTLFGEATPDGVIMRCSGRLVSSTADRLKHEARPHILRGRSFVLDLSEVTFMDSMGLGTIAGLWVSSRNALCQIEVVNLSPRIRDLFTVTNMLSLFEPAGGANARIL